MLTKSDLERVWQQPALSVRHLQSKAKDEMVPRK